MQNLDLKLWVYLYAMKVDQEGGGRHLDRSRRLGTHGMYMKEGRGRINRGEGKSQNTRGHKKG